MLDLYELTLPRPNNWIVARPALRHLKPCDNSHQERHFLMRIQWPCAVYRQRVAMVHLIFVYGLRCQRGGHHGSHPQRNFRSITQRCQFINSHLSSKSFTIGSAASPKVVFVNCKFFIFVKLQKILPIGFWFSLMGKITDGFYLKAPKASQRTAAQRTATLITITVPIIFITISIGQRLDMGSLFWLFIKNSRRAPTTVRGDPENGVPGVEIFQQDDWQAWACTIDNRYYDANAGANASNETRTIEFQRQSSLT